MANGQILHDRKTQDSQPFLQDLGHREVAGEHVVLSPRETTKTNPADSIQQASRSPLGQLPIDPVGRLAGVFKD